MYTKILIAEDHPLVREGIKKLLTELTNEESLLEAAHGKGVIEQIDQNTDIALVVLDFMLPDTNGFELLKTITNTRPGLPIAILSAYDDSELMRKCLDYGASGFIPKSASQAVILNALRLIMSGGIYIPPEMMRNPQYDTPESPGNNDYIFNNSRKIYGLTYSLTERQLQVLKLISEGNSNKDIAEHLDVSENTIKVHVAAILKTLQVNNRTEAVIVSQKIGAIEKK